MAVKGSIERARIDELGAVHELLRSVGLPSEGVQDSFEHFFVWRPSTRTPLEACIGIEVYGSNAVLRSMAVDPKFRSLGIGTRLLNAVLAHARQSGVSRVYLLTTTAPDYFSRKGFMRTDRETVSAAVAQSVEFASVCPKSAICMSMDI